MPRLVVNPGTAQAWKAPLKPGVNTVGRQPDNDVCLADSSVSGHHCRIIWEPDGARIEDLGSTNGTFVEGAPVQEARLAPGQRIRLGGVEVLYEEAIESSPGLAVPIPPPVPGHRPSTVPSTPAAVPVAVQFCRAHPQSLARAWCPRCQRGYCDLCVFSRVIDGVPREFCRACGSECVPVEVDRAAVVPRPKSFAAQVPGAFLYPFRGIGPFFLGFFGVAFPLLEWVGKYGLLGGPFVAGGVLVGLVLLTGYLYACLQHFVICSAQGQPEPTWPEVTSLWQDILSPFFRFIGLGLVCAGPALVLAVTAVQGHAWAAVLLPASIVLAGVYFPMAFLAVSMFDSLSAVNPLLIVPSMLRVPLPYLLVLAAFFVGGLVKFGGDALLDRLTALPVLPGVLSSALGFYFLAVQTRLLGLLYACHKDRLGWFG